MLSGSAVAGVITDVLNPSYCFLIYSGFGLLVAINAMCLPKEIELDDLEEVTCGASFSRTCSRVGQAFKIPPLKRLLIFYVAMGCTIPVFVEFMYFFYTDVSGFTQIQYGILGSLGAVFLFMGILLFNVAFKGAETRSLIMWAIIIEVVGGVFSLLFVLRVNLKMHIPDFIFVLFT